MSPRGLKRWVGTLALTLAPFRVEPTPAPPTGAGVSPQAAPGYTAAELDSLFRGARDRRGGATGGFEGSLGIADVAYRLGTGSDPVSPAEVGGLLDRYRGQVGLSLAHEADLRRVLTERPAFAAWARFFADGGRVQPFQPVDEETLRTTPPSRLSLVGEGRYVPGRRLILSRPDEPAMDAFLFHEIQHYVFDRWDSPLFEAGEGLAADHEVIEVLEERRRLVAALRAGRLPMDDGAARVVHDARGAATDLLRAGRWDDAVERLTSEEYYRSWVGRITGRLAAKNESNRRVRIVTLRLSDGRTLLFDERGERQEPDEITATQMRIPPDYRYGPVIYTAVREIAAFELERLFAEGLVTDADRAAVEAFVAAHGRNPDEGRGHVFSDAQLQGMAHLSAYNAALFQQAVRLAGSLRDGTSLGLGEVMGSDRYAAMLDGLLKRCVDRMAADPGADPRQALAGIAEERPHLR